LRGDAERLGRLLDAQPAEISKLDHLRPARLLFGERVQGVVERTDFDGAIRTGRRQRIQRPRCGLFDRSQVAAALRGGAGGIDENSPLVDARAWTGRTALTFLRSPISRRR
jgi:hypothetical protein